MLPAGGPPPPNDIFKTDEGIPFHFLRRQRPAQPHGGTGNENQLQMFGLEDTYHKFCDRKIKDTLSSFLPNVPGYIGSSGTQDDTLQSLIDKPPIGGKELLPLREGALQGFRLMPGSVPEQFKFMNKPHEKKKKKKHKYQEDSPKDGITSVDNNMDRKHKKRKHEEGDKRKKEKKKKKKKDKKGEEDEK